MKKTDPLKLFVLGERSGNPDDWREYSYLRAIVVAESAEAALAISKDGEDDDFDGYDDVHEIDMSVSRVITEESRHG